MWRDYPINTSTWICSMHDNIDLWCDWWRKDKQGNWNCHSIFHPQIQAELHGAETPVHPCYYALSHIHSFTSSVTLEYYIQMKSNYVVVSNNLLFTQMEKKKVKKRN